MCHDTENGGLRGLWAAQRHIWHNGAIFACIREDGKLQSVLRMEEFLRFSSPICGLNPVNQGVCFGCKPSKIRGRVAPPVLVPRGAMSPALPLRGRRISFFDPPTAQPAAQRARPLPGRIALVFDFMPISGPPESLRADFGRRRDHYPNPSVTGYTTPQNRD